MMRWPLCLAMLVGCAPRTYPYVDSVCRQDHTEQQMYMQPMYGSDGRMTGMYPVYYPLYVCDSAERVVFVAPDSFVTTAAYRNRRRP